MKNKSRTLIDATEIILSYKRTCEILKGFSDCNLCPVCRGPVEIDRTGACKRCVMKDALEYIQSVLKCSIEPKDLKWARTRLLELIERLGF